jgi:cytochrome P450
MERRALADDEVGGYPIPAGSTVVLCQYVTHRHPAFWPDPERFDPDRFLPAVCEARPHYAWFPFGAGPRYCIGSQFALTEARLITAMVARAFRLDLVPGFPVEPMPGITLRARHGLRMKLSRVGGDT